MDKHNASVVLLYPELGCFVQVFGVDGVGQKVSLSNYLMCLLQSMLKDSLWDG